MRHLKIMCFIVLSSISCIFAMVANASFQDTFPTQIESSPQAVDDYNGFAEFPWFKPGYYRMTIESRAQRPYGIVEGLPFQGNIIRYDNVMVMVTIDHMTRHHIIPDVVLRDFFNNVMQRGHTGLLRQFFNAFGNSLRDLAEMNGRPKGDSCSNPATAIQITRAATLAVGISRLAVQPYEEAPSTDRPCGFKELTRYWEWLPGNLFVGPQPEDRADDPRGREFEENAMYLVDYPRYQILWSLYNYMEQYINHQYDETVLLGIIDPLLHELVTRYPVINQFNPMGWYITETGKYAILDWRVSTPQVQNGSRHNNTKKLQEDFCLEIHPHYEEQMFPYYSLITAYNPNVP